jgi:hypothetical protein
MRTGLRDFYRGRAAGIQRRGGARYGTMVAAGSREGVALVITLILLSVITFMAITFLVVSRSEQGQVHTETDQTIAKLAADSGLAEAELKLLTPMMVYGNEYNFDLLVSTNYVNPFGFVSGIVNPTNVNFEYLGPTHAPLAAADRLQNIANLMISPRVPVYVTNRVNKSMEFSFYYDVNRNGRYDTNGLQPVLGPFNGQNPQYYDTNGNLIPNIIPGNTASNNFVGDPEWIGMPERPWLSHSGTNRFGARFCYIVVPIGKSLDINYMHNYARFLSKSMASGGGDSFIRNQGAASWEINLGAFLTDLNTNVWPAYNMGVASPFGARYFYNTNHNNFGAFLPQPNSGAAFDDALSVLRYRYTANNNANYQNLWSAAGMFGNSITNIQLNNVDNYSHGPFMLGSWYRTDGDTPLVNLGWAGSPNPTHIFTPQEFFDKNKINTGGQLTIADRLNIASTNNDSYNRYTFFRMLSQLGTESAPEIAAVGGPKMNLSYDNLVQSNSFGVKSATNFIPWRPVDFFTNAALRMLANEGYGTNFIVNGNFRIQIFPTNHYSPSVHRMLQVAANLYDVSINKMSPPTGGTNAIPLPSIFRPIFQVGSVVKGSVPGIYITGYEEVTDNSIAIPATAPIFRDLNDPNDRAAMKARDMVYGVPLVVGAKKGLPNFNELALETKMYVTRKLEFRRPATSAVNETNQMYIVGVSNVFAVEAWNSYSNALNHQLQMIVSTDISMQFSNEVGVMTNSKFSQGMVTNFTSWPGFLANGAFKIPLSNTVTFLPTSTYRQSPPGFIALTRTFERGKGFEVPHWWVTMNTRTRFMLVDIAANHVVDYVNLNSTDDPIDITAKMMEGGDCSAPNGAPGSLWCTNRLGNSSSINAATYGIMNQIHVGDGSVTPNANEWLSFNIDPVAGQNVNKAIAGFKYNLYGVQTPGYGPYYTSNVFYAPFNPFRQIYQHTTLQANDPLVHYTVGDLTNLEKTNNVDFIEQNPPLENIGRLNNRYEPWTTTLQGHSSSPTLFDLSVKDPGVGRSDDWEFPTNKLPNVGWIGRVHRGTPWQTIYLKAPIAQLAQWAKWSGNGVILTNWNDTITTNYDAEFSHPINDRKIVDLFTAAVNDDAGRGQLSVNQTSLAAWSAVLSGVIALTNVVSDADLIANPFLTTSNSPYFIDPAGIYDNQNQVTLPPIVRILAGINKTRASTNLFPKQVFTHMGDILAVPELTIGSAYMNPTNYVGTYPNGHWTGVSPFLNLGNPGTLKVNSTTPSDHVTTQQARALNDAAYERLPQQILGLLRLDQAPRFVIYSYGQALKPAEHSVVLNNGPYFLMCTNYQVSAEVATRAVVRIEGAPTKPHVVIEKFNVLPPD